MKSKLRAAAGIFGLTVIGVLAPAIPASATTINVTIPDDVVNEFDGECSLREAIISSDRNIPSGLATGECPAGDPISVGEDTIVLPTDTYLLTNGDLFADVEPNPETGDLDIFDQELPIGGGLFFGSAAQAQPETALTIQGNGSIVDACQLEHFEGVPAPDRVFHIHGVGAEINNLTIQGGGGTFNFDGDNCPPPESLENDIIGWGGGILVDKDAPPTFSSPGGALSLNGSVVRGNTADFGGGIYNNMGHVELHDSLVGGGDLEDETDQPNIAMDEGGGVYTEDEPQTVNDTFLLDNSRVDGNIAVFHGGGIYNEGDRVEIINESTVSNNLAGAVCFFEPGGGNGGGIWTNAQAEFVPNGDTPTPTADSNGVFIDDSTIAGNEAIDCSNQQIGNTGYGGGIYNENPGDVFATGATVIGPDNFAEYQGGGVWTGSNDSFFLTGSTVDGNSAGNDGGGIYVLFDSAFIEDSTVSNNTAEDGYGGGIYIGGGPGLVVTNSTISGNSAETAEDQVVVEVLEGSGLGGGIYSGNGGEFLLESVTLNNNSADACADVPPEEECEAGGNIATGAVVEPVGALFNTIVANGTPENCSLDLNDDIDSLGFNLSDENPDSCGLEDVNDILGQDPLLGPLSNNGGETETHALPPTSSAVDSGPSGGGDLSIEQLLCPDADQRGVVRPQDGNGDGIPVCDRGAFEREPAAGEEAQEGPPLPPPRLCDITGTTGADILIGTALSEGICGLAGDDTIRGEGGNDNLFGDPGDDRLNGGPGDDGLVGGPGEDTGDYSDAPGSVDADLSRQTTVGVGASTDTLFTLENLIGSAFNDTLAGDGGSNKLRGKGGNDRLIGRGGNDFMRGARGNDNGKGGGGNDTLKGGHDRDKLSGGGGEDTITGGQKKDKLKGNGGNDNVRGGGGDDHVNGNAGTDDCNGGSGQNTLVNCEI